jgi:nucleotide-binding universal stress UspA family protein
MTRGDYGKPTGDHRNPKGHSQDSVPGRFSEFSASVLAYAAAFANLFGSEITVLHVFTTAVPPAGSETYPAWLLQVPEARKSIADELHLLLAPLSSADVTVRTQIAEGNTAAESIRHAAEHDVDIVVMGTHGRSGFDRLTLGSVAERCSERRPARS